MDIIELEKIRMRISSQLIQEYGYDPYLDSVRRSNPDDGEHQFDIDKLREIKERQIIINQIKHLKFFENKTTKEIATLLSKPLNYIKSIVRAFKAGEIEKIRKEQAVTLFRNSHGVEEIAELMQIAKKQVTKWLADLGLIPKEPGSKNLPRKKAPPLPHNRKPHAGTIKEQVLKLCQETNLSYAEIAKIVGVPRTTVNKWCKRLTGKTRIDRPSADQKSRALILCETSTSYTEIADSIGTSTNTIRRWCDPIRKKKALELLSKLEHNYLEVAKLVGVPPMVIRRWERESHE